MEFGICVASRPADIDDVVRAEALGYSHAWMADSQMIWSDVYAMLALVADRTTTMRVGTGVAVAGTRPAPVTAAAMATINQLAPGRTFCGIGTGNTAMRIMGHKPMRIAEFERYLEMLQLLLLHPLDCKQEVVEQVATEVFPALRTRTSVAAGMPVTLKSCRYSTS